jgi:hypothetical protein
MVTEIATGLGMSGCASIDEALDVRPTSVRFVSAADWGDLNEARGDAEFSGDFERAWANGRAFLLSDDGLRGRPPQSIEWCGTRRAPERERIPADLRVDHVYIISCKFLSTTLHNSAPASLFDDQLRGNVVGPDGQDGWFLDVAPEAFQAFYGHVRAQVGPEDLPGAVRDLGKEGRARIRAAAARTWPLALQQPYREFARTVSEATAARWREGIGGQREQERLLWRLLRVCDAQYFYLGQSATGALRFRVGSTWDWRQRFRFRSFAVDVADDIDQPRVEWAAKVRDDEAMTDIDVAGYVEVRWGHGRFSTVEAKVHLITGFASVPGYFGLR